MGRILKDMIKEQEITIGGFQQIPNAEVTESMAVAGFDFLILDLEHSPATIERAFPCITTATARDVPMLVRVNEIETNLIEQALDAGAQGVVVPTVETVEQCELIVNAAKYAPMGERGWCPVPYNNRWLNDYNPDTYIEDANRDTFVTVLIETPLGFENLPDILKVDGIDAVQLGGGDLSIRLGKTMLDPEVVAIIERANKLIKGSNKWAMPMVMESNVADLKEDGARVFYTGTSDFVTLQGMSTELSAIRTTAGVEKKNGASLLDGLYKAPENK